MTNCFCRDAKWMHEIYFRQKRVTQHFKLTTPSGGKTGRLTGSQSKKLPPNILNRRSACLSKEALDH